MSEYSELVRRLRGTWTMDAVQGDNPQLTELEMSAEPAPVCLEAAQAIERLEEENEELGRRATFIEHEHPQKLEPHFSEAMGLLTTRKAFRKGEIAQLLAEQMQQLADAWSEIERKDRALEFYRDNWEFWREDETADGGAGYAPTEALVSDHGKQAREALAAPAPEPRFEVTGKGGVTVVHTRKPGKDSEKVTKP